MEHVGGALWSKGIKADIGRREEKEWRARVEAKPRLRSYKLIKVKLELEEYLEFTSGKRKTALVEMRSGANDLEIEMGRRRRVEVAERVCAECKGGVEDEMHLVLECPVYEQSGKRCWHSSMSWGTCSGGDEGGDVELYHGRLRGSEVEGSRNVCGSDVGGEEEKEGRERGEDGVICAEALGSRLSVVS